MNILNSLDRWSQKSLSPERRQKCARYLASFVPYCGGPQRFGISPDEWEQISDIPYEDAGKRKRPYYQPLWAPESPLL